MTKTRESNFELLRIFAIMGVVILHSSSYFFSQYTEESLFYDWSLHGLHAIFVASVNIFLMITGFFMCNKNSVTIEKPFMLYLQGALVSVGLYVLAMIWGNATFSVKSLVFRFVPNAWFLVIYIALFLLIPFLNLVVSQLSEKSFKVFLGVSLFCFSFWAIGVDIIEYLVTNIQKSRGGAYRL